MECLVSESDSPPIRRDPEPLLPRTPSSSYNIILEVNGPLHSVNFIALPVIPQVPVPTPKVAKGIQLETPRVPKGSNMESKRGPKGTPKGTKRGS